eukprot:CAMPEP_0118874428 /NCGR_PEP_ID=MMETSP1163-20130328/15878_1 /TAXON_ID=124430 /ORGANISM="Phaeomonas parva, Strain CCMP2877" /LENGTH=111 /DNA_ID=CAMNT_0006809819 /DNA_START=20 /DNA_END=351 /DNA_ORIENTATION=+
MTILEMLGDDVEKYIDAETPFGDTALTTATELGDEKAASLFITAGADMNRESSVGGKTPLIQAVKAGQVEMVKFLINKDVFLNQVTRQRVTAFDWAHNLGREEILKALKRV